MCGYPTARTSPRRTRRDRTHSTALATITAPLDTGEPSLIPKAHPTGSDPFHSIGDDYGAFGYRGAFAYSNAWGAYAVTPSGMVQMALDGIGRTNNTAFGNPSNDPDQRWNSTETFYADNFCNS